MKTRKKISVLLLVLLFANLLTLGVHPVMAEEQSLVKIPMDFSKQSIVGGMVHYVDDDGLEYPNADFKTIGEALARSNTGDRILVYPGTYTENIQINKSISLESVTGAGVTTIKAANTGSHVVDISASNVKVKGFTLTGATGDKKAGFHLAEGSNNCLISDNISSGNYSGLGIYKGYGNIVTRNTFSNNTYGLGLTEGANGTCAAEQAVSEVENVSAQEKDQVLNSYRTFRDVELKSEISELYYKYSPMLSSILLNRPDMAMQAYQLMKKYMPIVQYSSQGGTGSKLSLTAQDVEQLKSFALTLEDQVGKKYPENNEDKNGLFNTIDQFVSQIDSFAEQDFATAFQKSIYAAPPNQGQKFQTQTNKTANYIYLNNFYQSSKNSVYADEWTNNYQSQYQIAYIHNGQQHLNYLGNYYDDYQGADANGDGIGDSPYSVAGTSNSYDNYTTVQPYDNYDLQYVKLTASTISGFAPLSISFKAIAPIPATNYLWDFNADGVADSSTNVNRNEYTFGSSGQYTVMVAALDYAGNEISSNLITISVVEPGYVSNAIKFQPYYPTNDNEPSKVMDGGRARRHYRLLDQNNNPLPEVTFNYRYADADNLFTASTDSSGYVSLDTGIMNANKDMRLEVLNPDNSVKQDVQNSPNFKVEVAPRSFSQNWSIMFGERASIGWGGPNVKLGPVKFETAKAGLEGGRSTTLDLTYDITGKQNDVTIGNKLDATAELSAQVGLFGKTWSKSKVNKPSLEVGISSSVKAGMQNGVSAKLEDFTNSARSDHNQEVLAAGAMFLETAVSSMPVIPVGMDTIMNYILAGLDMSHYRTVSSQLSAGGSFSGGASLGVKNPLGTSKPNANTALEVNLGGISGSAFYAFGMSQELDKNPAKKTTNLGFTGSVELSALKTTLKRKFGDGRKRDTPEGSVTFPSLLDWKGEAKEAVEVERTGQDVTKISIKQGIPTGSDSVEENFNLALSGNSINEVNQTPGPLRDMVNGDKIIISPLHFNELVNNALDMNNSIDWSMDKSDVNDHQITFDLGLGLGLNAGIGIDAEYKNSTTYVAKKGVSSPKGQLALEEYDKDLAITQQQQNLDSFLKVFKDALSDAVKAGFETVKNIAAEGVKLVNAKVQGAWQDATVSLSRLVPQNNSYQVLVLPQQLEGEPRKLQAIAIQATTIGDVYIVNMQDSNNNIIEDFSSNPLSLTMDYTDQDLATAGVPADVAEHLAIYFWDGSKGYYVYQPSTVDIQKKQVFASITKPGQYILAVDTTGPRVSDFQVSDHTALPTITAIVSDDLSGVDKSSFQFYLDGNVLVGGDNIDSYLNQQTGRFKYIVDTPLSAGQHKAELSINDSTGNGGPIDPLIFTVNNTPPIITHDPVTMAVADQDLNISAQITDDTGVAEVDLFYKQDNGEQDYQTLVMTKGSGDSFSAVIPKATLTSNLSYYIEAHDIDGNVVATQPVLVSIQGISAPVVTSTYPVSGGIVRTGNAEIGITFSREITPGDNYAEIKLMNGSARVDANYVVTDNRLLISPTVPLIDKHTYSLIIPVGAVRDIDGNTSSDFYTFSFMADQNASEGDQAVFGPKTITDSFKFWTIRFNQVLNPQAVTKENIYVVDEQGRNIQVTLEPSIDYKSVKVLAPQSGYTPGEIYTLVITRDLGTSGQYLKKPTLMQFSVLQ